jgi:hypothetical protein
LDVREGESERGLRMINENKEMMIHDVVGREKSEESG